VSYQITKKRSSFDKQKFIEILEAQQKYLEPIKGIPLIKELIQLMKEDKTEEAAELILANSDSIYQYPEIIALIYGNGVADIFGYFNDAIERITIKNNAEQEEIRELVWKTVEEFHTEETKNIQKLELLLSFLSIKCMWNEHKLVRNIIFDYFK
jgi:hypothetical protein